MENDSVVKHILYKYRGWGNTYHKACLEKRILYFSPPGDLNDPFDSKINADFSLLDDDEKIRQYVELGFQNLPQDQLRMIKDINRLQERYISEFKNNPDKFQMEYNRKEVERANKHFGVLCLALQWESTLMWSHYAESHTGVCLGFSREKMEAAKIGASGPVRYTNDFPIIDPLDTNHMQNILLKNFTKALSWAYEMEYRISKIGFPELSPHDRLYRYPDDFLVEIIVGERFQASKMGEIFAIANSMSIPVFRVLKRPKSFDLDRVRIYQ